MIIKPPRRQYIPGIYGVYTANWVIIYYLPPILQEPGISIDVKFEIMVMND